MNTEIFEKLTLTKKTYAGIGSRKTPPSVIRIMELAGKVLADKGLILRSGAADGADSAFETGCDESQGKKEIFLPWKGFNHHNSELYTPSEEAERIASQIHPAWGACNQAAKLLHSRNCHQILGENLDSPCAFVLFWAPEHNGKVEGGTATAVHLARQHGIECFNLQDQDILEEWKIFLVE